MEKKWEKVGSGRVHCLFGMLRRATPFFNTLPRAADRLMARQLTRKAENLFKRKKYKTEAVAERS